MMNGKESQRGNFVDWHRQIEGTNSTLVWSMESGARTNICNTAGTFLFWVVPSVAVAFPRAGLTSSPTLSESVPVDGLRSNRKQRQTNTYVFGCERASAACQVPRSRTCDGSTFFHQCERASADEPSTTPMQFKETHTGQGLRKPSRQAFHRIPMIVLSM